MRALWVARNIPSPVQARNPVILEVARRLEERGSWTVRVVHPLEYLPRLPYPVAAMRAHARLRGFYEYQGRRVDIARYLRLPGERLSYLAAGSIFAFEPWLLEEAGRCDLVHCHHVLPDGRVGLAAKERHGVPFVVTARQGDLAKMARLERTARQRRMFERVLRGADAVIAHNGRARDELARIGVQAVMLPHGIDPTQVGDPRVRAPRDGATVDVLVVARLAKDKNVDWVLRAVSEYPGPATVRCTVVGDGPLRAALEAIPPGKATVRFVGRKAPDEVGRFYEEADVFALPCRNETFGVVFLEAMARGNAVVTLKGDGVWDWFAAGREILYADDYASFARLLHRLLDDGPGRREIGAWARQRVREEFVWPRVLDRYEALYQGLLSRRGRGGG